MSTRLSGATKDMINKAYNTKIRSFINEIDKMKEHEVDIAKDVIINSKPYQDLMQAALNLQKFTEDRYSDFYWYSTFRDLFRIANNGSKDFGYFDKDHVYTLLKENKDFNMLQFEINRLEKEKNSLLFKLENAPIKSKDYEEAYNKLKEILNQE